VERPTLTFECGIENLYDMIFDVWSTNTNVEGNHFVSGQPLRQILTRDAIRDALLDRKIFAPYHVDQVIDAVLKGAHKTFAILVLIKQPKCIRKFIEHDQYHSSGLDRGLPFEEEKLSIMLPSRRIAVAFREKQWGFIAPIFCESIFTRTLPSMAVLPFLQEEKVGCGGFGEVYMIRIASSHQRLGDPSLQNRVVSTTLISMMTMLRGSQLVRKAFKPHDGVRGVYENELRNLSILRLLRHPNIIEVLSSYAYRGELNLIFPQARAGTLATFLQSPRPSIFAHDHMFLVALSGLCSAVSVVHRIFSPDHNLDLIGCHHDLKPANVLIDGSKFLLADFGLSRFKTSNESSGTSPRRVHPYYAAPECCEPASDSGTSAVHRSSDIWSLGCIVAEVVTHMLYGPKGVRDFESQRRFVKGPMIHHRFHRGDAEEPSVIRWLENLEQSTSSTSQMLGLLVSKMLQLRPQDRPSAGDVEIMMNFVGFHATCKPIHEAYSRLCRSNSSIEASLERAQFRGWMYAAEVFELPTDLELGRWSEGKNFQSIHKTLGEIFNTISLMLLKCEEPASYDLQLLRQLNDLLVDELSPEARNRANLYDDIQMMSNPCDVVVFARLQDSDASISNPRRLRMLSLLTSMTKALQCRHSCEGAIDPLRLVGEARVDDFKVQLLENDRADYKREVIVETRTYEEHCKDIKNAQAPQLHLQEVVDMLERATRVYGDSFRALPCAGFYQDAAALSCGIVYEYPDPSKHQDFTTLNLALKESQHHPERQPSLDQRFQLAHALARSVLQFHRVLWLQKSISSLNIVIFFSTGESWLTGIDKPFFLGYSHSENVDGRSIAESTVKRGGHERYQHPDYCEKNPRFRPEYDYHSLGLVLLEIGLWISLDKISDDVGSIVNSAIFLDTILRDWAPRLRISMGTRYQRVVETCLRGNFEITEELQGEDKSKLYLGFSSLVLEQLATVSL
jgi:serine/threonine protein kinase